MRDIASVAIAGLIAATSLTTATPADADGKHWKKHYHHGKHYRHRDRGWDPGAALATGAILGFAFGALTTPTYHHPPRVYAYPPPPPPPYPTYYSYSYGPYSAQHVSWCYGKYRSYNAKYNTWVGYDGLTYQCISPYY